MKQPIGIVELYSHNEVLIHYCNLLVSKNHPLYVFCSRQVFEDLPSDLKKSTIKWFLNDSEKNISKFIKKQEASLKECRFLLITTVFSHFNSFTKIASWVPSALIIHSAHTWLQPFRFIHLREGHKVADFLRLIKFVLLGQPFLRKKLLKQLKYIGLPNNAILNYVTENFTAPNNTTFVSIPFGAHLGHPNKTKPNDPITYTITGSLGDDVRDYPSILDAFKLITPQLQNKIRLIFLGKPLGKKGIQYKNDFDQLKHACLEVVTFSEYISQERYDEYLSETDYLILPLKKHTQFYVFQELTCYSKLSGSVNDMIRYGIPAIASSNCTVDEKVDSSLLYYETTSELAGLILNLSKKEKGLSSKTLNDNFSNFLPSKLKHDLITLIETSGHP